MEDLALQDYSPPLAIVCIRAHNFAGVPLVSCPACVRLLERNGLVNKVEILGHITNEIARSVIIM